MRNLYLVLALLFSLPAFAQFDYAQSKTDSISYNMYMKKDWNGLIAIDKANSDDMLPYYTKYRIALANYYSGRLLKATGQFVNLYKTNKLDSNLLKSTYYSLVEAGFTAQAADIKRKAIPVFRRSLPLVQLKNISDFNFGYGSSVAKQNSALTSGFSGSETYQETDLMKRSNYSFFTLEGQITPRLSYRFDYSVITLNRSRVFDYKQTDSIGHAPDSFSFFGFPVPYDSTIYQSTSMQNKQGIILWQNQIYGALSYKLGLRAELNAFGLSGNYRYQEINSTYRTDSFLAQSYHTIYSYKPGYSFQEKLQVKRFWLTGAEVGIYNKSLNLKHVLGVSRGYLNNGYTSQVQYSANWYPKNNFKLFIKAQVTAVKNDTGSTNMVYNLLIGKSLSKRLYASVTGTYGNFKNSHTEMGRILYNYPDNGNYRAAATLGCRLNANIRAELTFSYINMEVSRTLYNSDKGFYTDKHSFQLYFPLFTLNYQL